MGVADTFALLASLPIEQRLAFVESALREPYLELQSAAFEALSGPGGLNRPDLVIHHFSDLVPEVRQKVAVRAHRFGEAARQELRSSREWSRRAAYEVLAVLDPKASLPTLVRGLADPSPVVRGSVADQLETLAHRYYYHLVTARMHGDPASREFLDAHRSLMVEALGPLLRSFAVHGKRVFVDIAIESGEDAYPLLSEILLNRADPASYATLVHALASAASESAVDLLFRLALDTRPRLQEAAHDAFLLRRDAAFPALVAAALSRLPPERFLALSQRSRDIPWWHTVESAPDVDPFSAAKIMEFVAKSGLDPVRCRSYLLHFRASPYPDVRIRVLSTFQALQAPGLLDLAKEALQDPAEDVQLAGVRTIIGLNPPDKAKLLLPLFNAGSEEVRRLAMREVASASFDRYLRSFDRLEPAVREAAAKALAKIDPRIVDRLGLEIESLDADRRLRALRVVDYVDAETDLRENLMSLLNDPDRRVRATAVKIVQLTASAEGMRHLVAALGDPDRRVRANAIEAFEDGADARSSSILVPFLKDPDNRVRGNAAKALHLLGRPEGTATIKAMLDDPQELMRLSGVWAAGEARYPGVVDDLLARAEREPSPQVRQKVLETLAALQGGAGLP